MAVPTELLVARQLGSLVLGVLTLARSAPMREPAPKTIATEGRLPTVEEVPLSFRLLRSGRVWLPVRGWSLSPLGSEYLQVFEPMFYLRARQNEKVTHTVSVPVDIITSASTDAVDVTTSASRQNEAGTVQIDTRVDQQTAGR